MPFLFLIVGLVMVVSAAKGTNQQLVGLLKQDFTGKNNFIYWMLAILAIGAVGYVQPLKPVSRAFLVLVVVVLILDSKGVFSQFLSAVNSTQNANNQQTQGMGVLTNVLTNQQSQEF